MIIGIVIIISINVVVNVADVRVSLAKIGSFANQVFASLRRLHFGRTVWITSRNFLLVQFGKLPAELINCAILGRPLCVVLFGD
jgi:hypothetical protein